MQEPEILIHPDVQARLACRRVVALESTLITHGLPYPANVETALAAEAAIREEGATPATIGMIAGQIIVGMTIDEIESLACHPDKRKIAARDLAWSRLNHLWGGTTVSATLAVAEHVGIEIFATGGIGGAHRAPASAWDISSDLPALARRRVLVVSAGAKNILDLPRTVEILETLAIPVIGFNTPFFPAFTSTSTNIPIPEVTSARDCFKLWQSHRPWNSGMMIVQSLPKQQQIADHEFNSWQVEAERMAEEQGISGPELTPFLLQALVQLSGGRTLEANRKLIIANAKLAAQIISDQGQG